MWAYDCLVFLLSGCHLKIKFASCVVTPHLTAFVLGPLRFNNNNNNNDVDDNKYIIIIPIITSGMGTKNGDPLFVGRKVEVL